MDHDRILIVEDDLEVVDFLKISLRARGFVVQAANNGIEGLNLALTEKFSVIILDVNLPGLDGFEVCRRIREKHRNVPIIFLTCQGEEVDTVLGFEVGADDYVAKPFRMNEMLARLRALIRRNRATENEDNDDANLVIYKYKDLTIDIDNRRVTLAGDLIELTRLEFGLLVYLASRPGRPHTREEILCAVWGTEVEGYEQAVTLIASRLRAKLDKDAKPPKYIQTVWGVGYRFGLGDKN